MNISAYTMEGDGWVHESRFGVWFQGTGWWYRFVLADALRELVRLLGPYGRFARILDVGCGMGRALPLLEAYFHPEELLGIDIDPILVEGSADATRRFACDVHVRVGDATRLDLPDGSMDMVFCHQTMHHLSRQEAAVEEFFRVLAPGGVLLFSESCRSFIYSLWVRTLFRHPMEVQKTSDEYQALLSGAGFVFAPENVATPYPSWARSDLGLYELLGRPVPKTHRSPLLNVAAFRPD